MKSKLIISILAAGCLISSCKKSFLEHPSETSPTLDNYYNNADEVNGATGILYNSVWGDWFDKAFIDVGDVMGGTLYTRDDNYKTFYSFNVQSTDGLVGATWKSCYKAAGNAAVLVNTFEQKADKVGKAPYLTLGIAEARFIRGFAYFYIARAFGDAPIVEDPISLTAPGKYAVPRYFQKDVLRFALEDLQFAEANLPDASYQPGRVTKYSAKGLIAKLYLYSKEYDKAKAKAKEVIDYATSSGTIGLMDDYQYMFTTSKANNNKESLFALQWQASMSWNGGNPYQQYLGPQPLLKPKPTTADGYSACVPSLDMLNPATGYEAGDKRRDWSVMEHGFTRTDWVNENFPTGFMYDTTTAQTTDFKIKTPTRSNVQKYIVGPKRESEPVNGPHTSMCTYILRYADVLLIYAEAVMGANGSSTDATALAAFNAVHTRAKLTPVTSITKDLLLHERKVEFAFEGDYWFDIQRQGFDKAKEMISKQERGSLNDNGTINSLKVILSSASQLFLPVPQAETVENPKLKEPAIAYY
ncbi:RagB/SusD family nutrient uptake outer membrane protein [Paraflavitalea sp. CAU 1676]|uniref:RagB/SusD family nutrient uptake outer membrane protein n=1 Tax=Paraflavitalea sp. CAU 1676 TaxID=3032598 RepID=UPI0023DBD637|nr:RagB/SusD family nutrient uptake outer membrane protein [Paraflavitalea sp. CAU 1676]MDF2188835.1 RagB/SusD family nutrient uptake outer membrane protein [Paraflavitalea sp. CAU 1676]